MKFASRRLLQTFIALSLLSLFADIIYEGARSIGGAYLNLLAAPAMAAGILGFGELLSYLMRLVGGVAAQKAPSGKVYWILIGFGYGVNLVIPLLALAGSWEIALILFFLERIGKGIRAPPRDVILSEVTEGVGRGKGFGLHELFDQIGAIAGPLAISLALFLRGYPEGYRLALWIMWIPWILSMIMLATALKAYPEPKAVIAAREGAEKAREAKLGRGFWIFLAGSTLGMLGFLYWGVISYYIFDLVRAGAVLAGETSLPYLVAMGVDAAIALPAGLLYDRIGFRAMAAAPIFAIPIAPMLLLVGGRGGLYASAILWGLTMGVFETIMRAAVADLAPIEKRGLAYGIYYSGVGLSWAAGGTIAGYLYQHGLTSGIIGFCTVVEIAALAAFILLPSRAKPLTIRK